MGNWFDTKIGATAWREAGPSPRQTPTDDAAVVFLHGLGGTRQAWNSQLTALSDHWRCLAWDMPGYGASDAELQLTFGSIARRIFDFLDVAQVGEAHLVGLSFGGMQALHAVLAGGDRARSQAGRIRTLTLADTSARFGADGTPAATWKASRLNLINQGLTPGDIGPEVIDAITARPLTAQARADLIGAFAQIPVEGFRAAVECLVHHDVVDRLGEIQQPTLVIVGELDGETPIAYARTLAEHISDSRLVVLADTGHLSPTENPDQFNYHLRTFLEGHSS